MNKVDEQTKERKHRLKMGIGSSFMVVTGMGYWGIGSTLKEAAMNANCDSNWVMGGFVRIPNNLIKDIYFEGGVTWEWRDSIFKILDPEGDAERMESINAVRQALTNMARFSNQGTMIRHTRKSVEVRYQHG